MPRARGWPPQLLTKVPPADVRRGDGGNVAAFAEAVCRVTKDSVGGHAGDLLRMRPWQTALVSALLARRPDGRFRHRTALVGMPRKNGKSSLGAVIGLFGLIMGPRGGEVYSLAADRDQAKVVFGTAKRMVELDPELSRLIKCYRDVLVFSESGSTYKALSAEAYTKEGLNPHLSIFDEVHAQPNRELWDVMSLAAGSREEPLMVGITTPGVMVDSTGSPSLCFGLYEYGQRVISGEVTDPSFFMAWWQAPRDADHRLEATWRVANPGYGDLVAAEDFASAVRRTPEAEFRTKRCGQWVAVSESWLPYGAWAGCADPHRVVASGARVVLSFDGSKTGDSTALLGVTVEDKPHLFVVGSWERPTDALEWRVPRADVKAKVREACRTYDVAEIAWDDFMWQDAREELEDDGLPVEVFPQTAERMGKATQRFYEAVVDHGLTHDGNPALTRHVQNALLKPTPSGKARIVKQSPSSKAWIDLAVTGVMGLDRAEWWAANNHPLVLPRSAATNRDDVYAMRW